jgi:hypothetical protein
MNPALFNSQRRAKPHPWPGSNPARAKLTTERHLGRAEILALPIFKLRFTFLQKSCHSFFLIFQGEGRLETTSFYLETFG